jgi:hypothetical protein
VSARTGLDGLAAAGAGHGIIGMRERVNLCGGSFRAGPRAEGGFQVLAALPLPAAGYQPDGLSGTEPVLTGLAEPVPVPARNTVPAQNTGPADQG